MARRKPDGKVIYDISMSLDGFIAGANAGPEAEWAGLGDGGNIAQQFISLGLVDEIFIHLVPYYSVPARG